MPFTADAAIETKRKECGKESMRLPSTAGAWLERKECGNIRMRLPRFAKANLAMTKQGKE